MDSSSLPFAQAAPDGSVSEHFEFIARRYGDQLAIADLSGTLTYAELARLVEDIAAGIEAATEGRPGTVAILLSNEARFPAAILGALCAARGCVPLNIDDPPDRNRAIAADASAAAVVSAGERADQARELFPDMPLVDIEAVRDSAMPRRRVRATGADLAYIIYTSGSTGKPKGVYQNHHGLLVDLQRAADSLGLSCADRQALFYPPSLISGFRVALGSLLTGGSLYILPPRKLQPAGVARAIRAHGITIFRGVPTLFRHVEESLAPDERLDSLRIVLLGGDRVDWRDFDAFRRSCSPDCLFGVHLGATECSLYLQWFVEERLRASSPRPPVGRILPGRRIVLVDEAGRPVADGELGEFHVSGRDLALGYWRDPERTARAFFPDPTDPELRTYRTGDLGRRRPDGLYEYMGRRDHQLKLHGHRIEPGEIESVLRACQGVRDAAVAVRRDSNGVPRALRAYVELDSAAEVLSPQRLKAMVATRLARRMMPSSVAIIEELPRLPNLKIDRVALAAIDAHQAAAAASDGEIAPRNKLEAQLCALYSRITRTARVGPQDDFFELGGDSLSALLLVTEARQALGYPISLGELYDHTTAAALATYLLDGRAAARDTNALPTLFMIPGAGGDSPRLERLRQRCAQSLRIVVLDFPDWPRLIDPSFDLTQLIGDFVEQIDAACREGPILLAGYSAGGFLGYAVARALLAANCRIGLFAILDVDATPPLEPGERRTESRLRVGVLRQLYWDLSRTAGRDMRGKRVQGLAYAIARVLTHRDGISVLRRLRGLRRLRLPTRFRHFLHRNVCYELHVQCANACRTAHLAVPAVLDVPVAVFAASDHTARSRRAPDFGWGPHCRSVRVVDVGGDHLTMLDEPHVGKLAAHLVDIAGTA